HGPGERRAGPGPASGPSVRAPVQRDRQAQAERQVDGRHLTPAVHRHPAAGPPSRPSLGVGGTGWGGAVPPVHTPAGRRNPTTAAVAAMTAASPRHDGNSSPASEATTDGGPTISGSGWPTSSW